MALIDRKLLEEFTGQTNLLQVLKLDIVVDTSEQSLTILSEMMPNLAFLNISYSRIGQLASLGSFANLEVLLADFCEISSLDGLFLLPALEKLSVRENKIADLAPLLDCAGVEYLDISHNEVDVQELEFLAHLPLTSLIIEGNPCDCEEGRENVQAVFPHIHFNAADSLLIKQAQKNSSMFPINATTHAPTDSRAKTIISGTAELVCTPYSWWKHWDLLSQAGIE